MLRAIFKRIVKVNPEPNFVPKVPPFANDLSMENAGLLTTIPGQKLYLRYFAITTVPTS